jgi:hypothetical protein
MPIEIGLRSRSGEECRALLIFLHQVLFSVK